MQSSKASLNRMLDQYSAQATSPGYSAPLYRAYRAVAGGKTDQGVAEPLDPFALVSARVEEELKSPLQNILAVRLTTFFPSFECSHYCFDLLQGDLMQLLLIQTQVMKVDMESALLQMDQIMRANRLNFSLMAGMPALLAILLSVSVGSTSLGMHTFQLSSNFVLNILLTHVFCRHSDSSSSHPESRGHANATCGGRARSHRTSVQRKSKFRKWHVALCTEHIVPVSPKTSSILLSGRMACREG